MGALFYAVLAVRDIFNLTDKKEILRTLCDAFTVPAVIAFCAGALVFVSSHGVFDGLGYIGRAILGAQINRKEPLTLFVFSAFEALYSL